MKKKELNEMKKELRDIHKTHNDGKLEIINFVLDFLKKDKKECEEAFIQEKKEGYINENNEDFWKDVKTGRDSLDDRIEFELVKLKDTLVLEEEQ